MFSTTHKMSHSLDFLATFGNIRLLLYPDAILNKIAKTGIKSFSS